MRRFRSIEIDGERYLWREILQILQIRREQKKAHATAQQPVLFELKHDCRPAASRTSAGRYLEPSLFEHMQDNIETATQTGKEEVP